MSDGDPNRYRHDNCYENETDCAFLRSTEFRVSWWSDLARNSESSRYQINRESIFKPTTVSIKELFFLMSPVHQAPVMS